MASKGAAETCRQCKQFRLMCLCPRDLLTVNGTEKTLLSRQSSVTLHSLAIYQSTLKRQQSVKVGHKSPKNNPLGQSQPAPAQPITGQQSNLIEAACTHPPEVVQVSRPVPIDLKRRILLRIVEANYTTSSTETNLQPPLPEELVAAVPSQRNWKGMFIAILVILSVIAMVALAVHIVTPEDPGPRLKGRRILLRDVISGRHKPRYFNGTWLSGSDILYQDSLGGLTITNLSDNTSKVFMSNSTFRQLNSNHYSLSGDLKYVLLEYSRFRLYRHSFTAQYSIYSLDKSSYSPLSLSGDVDIADRLQMASWSPSGHALAVVRDNDLYYLSDISAPPERLTNSGRKGLIFNGIADWLYEEEILSQSSATWFSPQGGHLLYATFNATNVGEVSFKIYEGEGYNQGEPSLYGTDKSLRYPKTGTRNPTVKLNVVDLKTKEQVQLRTPKTLGQKDHYFTSVRWIDDDVVSVTWMNRVQNLSVVTKCSPPAYLCHEVYHERTADGWGWIENRGPPTFSASGSSMVTIRSVQDQGAGFWPQIVQVDISGDSPSNDIPTSLTHGQFEVTQLVGWDESSHYVYFIATLPERPDVRHLFRVQDASTHTDTTPVSSECLSCNTSLVLSPTQNVSNCQYSRASLSKDYSHYVLDCLGPSIPFSAVYALPQNKLVKVLDDNEDLKEAIAALAMPKIRFYNYTILEGATAPARVKMLIPPGFREAETYTFPLVLRVYGGPGTQEVSQRWSFDWDHYLAGNRDFIVATVDVRGTGFSGDSFKQAVYRDLGRLETFDTLTVLRHIVNNFTYIDETRVAVWGWSYGGYLAGQMLAEDKKGLLTCAVSVAPVVKWQLYDSAYTERYMDLPGPGGNWKGYESSDLSAKAMNFYGKNYFLIHGTADDNVHFQQSMVLTRALVDFNILFRLQVYPDQSHSLPQVRQHQYLAMEDFLEATFQDNPSISRNDHQLYWDMDSLLLPTKISENTPPSSAAELPNQDIFENSD